MEALKILWADDEIDLLKPHIMFLEDRGYKVTSVTNGNDAVSYARKSQYDVIMLDEMMPGKDGLTALVEIRDFNPQVPIIMVTKNEEESLMEEAIGQKITDYLTKPVNPSQILLTLKKVFDSRKIAQAKLAKDYSREFMSISETITGDLSPKEWIDINLKIIDWEMELDNFPELGFQDTVYDLHRDCNANFSRFVESNYL
ncbi:response regulator, partial [candidate division KSB1 bacterium]|nr:response regulator [candidate division KSB1 bacterium]